MLTIQQFQQLQCHQHTVFLPARTRLFDSLLVEDIKNCVLVHREAPVLHLFVHQQIRSDWSASQVLHTVPFFTHLEYCLQVKFTGYRGTYDV